MKERGNIVSCKNLIKIILLISLISIDKKINENNMSSIVAYFYSREFILVRVTL